MYLFIPLYPQSLHSAETGSVLGGKENRKLFSVLFLILILFQMLFHVHAGRHSVQILESGREIVGIGESGQVRHFGYGVPFLRQQFCRLFQSDVPDKIPCGLVGQLFLFTVQVHAANAYLGGNHLHGEVRVAQVFVDDPHDSFHQFVIGGLYFYWLYLIPLGLLSGIGIA